MPARSRALAVALTVISLLVLGIGAAPASATNAPAPSLSPSPLSTAFAALSPPSDVADLDVAGLGADLDVADPGATDSAASSDGTVPAAPRLPACKYVDKPTRFDKVRNWRKTLLDTNLRVTRSYAPGDLVLLSRAGIGGSGRVRKVIIEDLAEMASAARQAGKPLAVRSAYRSYDTQVATFNAWVRQSGYQRALKFAARPGHSEHQLGTTLDFMSARSSKAPWAYPDFARTPAGKWLIKNSWKYGFVLSYPKGMQRVSCYGYEPWHYRYVGRELARQIHESGLVPRRYLWENFESAP